MRNDRREECSEAQGPEPVADALAGVEAGGVHGGYVKVLQINESNNCKYNVFVTEWIELVKV
jgi:hypothetical protein